MHTASGRTLPVLIESGTGKIIEVFKEARGARVLSQVANLSTAIVGAAHFIASADISKRLHQLNCKVDLLLAFRRIDQVAALERIFTMAKEIARSLPGRSKRLELWRLRGELRELRSVWRRELEHHLRQIENPEDALWILRTLSPQSSLDQDVQQKIAPIQVQLGLIEYALRLDQALAIGSESTREFSITLGDEMKELEAVASLLEEKANYIKLEAERRSVDPLIEATRTIVSHYQSVAASMSLDSGIRQLDASPIELKARGLIRDQ
jgi:hypothetical protein